MTLSVGAELFRSLAVRIIIRRWTRQRLKTLALLLVVALGVSVFLSIGLTNRAAVSSFGSFTEIVAGQSQYSVRSTIGSLAIEDARSVREALMDVVRFWFDRGVDGFRLDAVHTINGDEAPYNDNLVNTKFKLGPLITRIFIFF